VFDFDVGVVDGIVLRDCVGAALGVCCEERVECRLADSSNTIALFFEQGSEGVDPGVQCFAAECHRVLSFWRSVCA